MTTRDVAEELLARMDGGTPEHIAELFAPTVDWLAAGSPAVSWLRPRRTRAEVAEFFREMATYLVPEERSVEPGHFLVDGEHAVVTGRVSQTVRSNGRAFTIPFAVHLTVRDGLVTTVRDGLVTRYHVYEDSYAVAEAVAAPAAWPSCVTLRS
ncbi:hypothetical protein SAMN05421810_102387 [Amycolatopsis arida]|uniref:SnoaL-like domain-containing protein n=1 Tax=Amycolatopsis arida TaxID=587909 RepID=A0A1I5PTF7_9PSEU|nr:nuclear transport factor 2 family protein [Amycolatopsis arida]TDX98594.1 hypothetical protein CLV69_101387 [Amycolatopsis arida]SFP37140.1 hypothetical protein SAMN05421810_102387 [Amycolatopsis arida]